VRITTTAITPHPVPAITAPTNTIFSYLDISALIIGDWQIAYPEDNRNAEEAADAILGSFSTERLYALLLAHLLA
jgi:hypothetical protein